MKLREVVAQCAESATDGNATRVELSRVPAPREKLARSHTFENTVAFVVHCDGG